MGVIIRLCLGLLLKKTRQKEARGGAGRESSLCLRIATVQDQIEESSERKQEIEGRYDLTSKRVGWSTKFQAAYCTRVVEHSDDNGARKGSGLLNSCI